MSQSPTLEEQVRDLPKEPGIYQYFNSDGEIIYIGKAKSLKSRVSSYFSNQTGHSRKTRKLVSEIARLAFIVVNTESDALLLENGLIKQHQPKYNILLKDDKTYPYICVTNEPVPRVFYTRQVPNKTDRYFGPYASVKAMHNVLDLVRQLYNIRSCQFFMDKQSVADGKHKICLEYHIKNCKGPCEGLQSFESYQHDIAQVVAILKGNLSIPKQYFSQKMQESAASLDFEQAQYFKERFDLLEGYQNKSLVANPNIADLDVCTLLSDAQFAYVNFIKIVNGCILQSQSVELKKKLDDETDEDLLLHGLLSLREKFNSQAPKIITNISLEIDRLGNAELYAPKIGDLKKLVDLSLKNLLYFKKERLGTKVEQQQAKPNMVLLQLQQDLGLLQLPMHIECFDNSNIQGTNPVAAMVCFKNGKAAKSEYRKFHVKTVIGPDDFASMREIVRRRYERLLEEDLPLPDLIIVDGGKGQLSAACQSLKELNLYGKIPIVGIAKRLEEIYYPEDQVPIHIHKKSQSLMLVQRIRDEAHRFAITFHRDTRSANTLKTALDDIKGIGPKTVQQLLSHFKTVSKIKDAPISELIELIGTDKAEKIQRALNME